MNTQIRIPCPRCLKPATTCYCREVRKIRTRVQFVILQHPLERRRTIGTARMVHLCVENSLLIAGLGFDRNSEVDQIIDSQSNHCVVLYPGANSLDLARGGLPAFPHVSSEASDKRLVIFVLDGNWSNAGKMLRRSPALARLPRVSFTPERESEYQIRRQPGKHCVSTLEAVHHVIGVLDPGVDASPLLRIFRQMVKQQVEYSRLYKIRRIAPTAAQTAKET